MSRRSYHDDAAFGAPQRPAELMTRRFGFARHDGS